MFARGEGGLKQDHIQALMWFSLSAAAKSNLVNGDPSTLAESFDPSIAAYAGKQRDTIAAKMTLEQISQAQRLAAAWKPAPQHRLGTEDAASAIQQSISAFNFHDYRIAYQLLQPLAFRGNAQAQEMVGTLYARGQDGINRDYAAAMGWYRTAAGQGNAQAEADIAWMYENGWGVERDYKEAVQWYQKAADLGNDIAQRNMEIFCAGGLAGVKHDDAAAVQWYSKAANQGDYVAQSALAGMYAEGKGGLQQDYVRALMWLTLATRARDATQNDFTIVDHYDSSIVTYAAKQRDAIAAKMTPEQISEAQRLSAGWKPLSERRPPL
jgi:TPR repeat protein